jgi:hypothetical protein
MPFSRVTRLAVLAISAVTVAGCGFIFETRAERATRNSPDFKSGYADGCATANSQGTDYGRAQTRDSELYRHSKPYRAGWAAGISACRSNLADQPGVPGSAIPDINPGR